jgi:hypothetical protein
MLEQVPRHFWAFETDRLSPELSAAVFITMNFDRKFLDK